MPYAARVLALLLIWCGFTALPAAAQAPAPAAREGKPGPITQRLLGAYMDIVRGVNKRYSEWRTPVYHPIVV